MRNEAENQAAAPEQILTDEQWNAQWEAANRAKRHDQQILRELFLEARGVYRGLAQAHELLAKHDPKSPARDILFNEVLKALEARIAANKTWNESL